MIGASPPLRMADPVVNGLGGGPLGIEDAAALLAAIVASSSDAILSKTLDGVITSWNSATERLFGYTAVEMIGQSIRMLFPPELADEEDVILAKIAQGIRIENYETVRLHKAGHRIDVSVTISPVRDASGRIVGASKIIRNITEKKKGERSAALLSAIVLSSTDGIVSKTLDGTVTSWNQAAERLFGYCAADMVGRSIRRIIPADRQDEEDEILDRVSQGDIVGSIETIRLRKNGTPLDVAVTISPILDRSGRVVGASKIIRDITQQKRDGERIRLLMAEVNHRAKNLLAVVQAIARQTTGDSQDDYRRRFQERLQGLALNHDLLTRVNWGPVSVEDVVARQIGFFSAALPERIARHGPVFLLNAKAAQQIAMAIFELASNSAKYGALSDAARPGTVEIAWAETEDRFSLAWTETIASRIAPPSRSGFGSRLLRRIVPASLEGRSHLDVGTEGVSWRLDVARGAVAGDTL